METLVESGMHKPILITNPYESYWEQLEALQSALERDWVELGRTGRPLALHDLLKLEYTTTTSKSTNIIRQTQKSTNIITKLRKIPTSSHKFKQQLLATLRNTAVHRSLQDHGDNAKGKLKTQEVSSNGQSHAFDWDWAETHAGGHPNNILYIYTFTTFPFCTNSTDDPWMGWRIDRA